MGAFREYLASLKGLKLRRNISISDGQDQMTHELSIDLSPIGDSCTDMNHKRFGQG